MTRRTRVRALAAAAAATLSLLGLAATPATATSATATSATATTPAAAAPHTTVTHVLPVTARGALAPGYRVTQTARGASCSAGSEVAAQGYRCFFGNVVADPCFPLAATSGFKVACLYDPFTTTVAVATGAGRLDATTGRSERPWGVKLANGTTCTLAQGAHSTVGGKVLQYYCSATTGLVGFPDTHHTPATIQAASFTALKGTYPIRTLVYAGFTH